MSEKVKAKKEEKILKGEEVSLPEVKEKSEMEVPVVEEVKVPEIDPGMKKVDEETVLYVVYLLYKANMLARNNLREIVKVVGQPVPEKLVGWLVKEAAKG